MSDKTQGNAATPQALSYPLWLAFVCAGLCFVASGYLGMTGGGWLEFYESLGVKLPYVLKFVLSHPVTLPLGLTVAGIVLLGLTRVRVRGTQVNQSLSAVFSLGAISASLLACVFVSANVLVFYSVGKALRQ